MVSVRTRPSDGMIGADYGRERAERRGVPRSGVRASMMRARTASPVRPLPPGWSV